MYHVSAQGIDERMINVHYYYYYYRLASNLVRCDLVLYVDSEIFIILSLSFIR